MLYPRLSQTEALVLYAQAGVVIEEHKVFASGRHGAMVINFDLLRENASDVFARSCFELAMRFQETPVTCVLGPADGGNPIAQSVADFLSANSPDFTSHVSFVPTKKDELLMPFVDEQYLEDLNGARVLIVDDVLNHGTNIRHLMRWLKTNGIRIFVMGVGVFWQRSNITTRELPVPIIRTIVHDLIQDWRRDECPLCKQGIPTVNSRPSASRHWV